MRWASRVLAVLATVSFLIYPTVRFANLRPVQQERADDLAVMQSMPSPGPARKLETPARSCVPQNSVYFLKTPKCASTTLSRSFTAYGVKHGLTFALPVRCGPIPISPKILPPEYHGSPDGRYHMVVSHTQFNKEGAEQVMKESAKYVATIREPASRFESNWYYGNYEKKLNMTLTAFLKASRYTRGHKSHFNKIADYFGVKDPRDDVPEGEVLSKTKWLNERFDLVMVTERFDESVVLLKHLMCWNTEDVAYIRAHVASPEYKAELSEAQKDRLRQLNRQDVLLYKFFREIFEEKVKAFGEERMQREVEELRQANARLINDCRDELTEKRRTVKTWKVTNNSNACKMSPMNDIDLHSQLRERQRIWVSSNLTYDLLTWTFTKILNGVVEAEMPLNHGILQPRFPTEGESD
ncbi:galactose-3-O-sulfotransferase 4-like [Penaeus chinensis]|uniref:galactose-3-O-sulfotransferase 4-like n=1 Tax=Penaeus chinensis TaxID=139456 RepID=UPI001FB7DC16|nr:galactose-3-O-sulfotransferase 4-like [Penaeus chinensis]